MAERPADTSTPPEPAREDITGDCNRLIHVRWVAGALVVLITAAGVQFLGLPLPETELYAAGAGLLIANGLFAWLLPRVQAQEPARISTRARRLVGLQVVLDGLALAVLINLTGGIVSPAIPFLLAHMMVAAVMLPGRLPYAWALSDTAMLALIAYLEGSGLIPHYAVMPGIPPDAYASPIAVTVLLVSVMLAGLAISHAARVVMARLQQREARIATLLRITRVASSTMDISDLLKSLTCISAESLSARGAMIHLLEEASESLSVASACGVGEAFVKHGMVALSHHALEAEIMAGKPVLIDDVTTDARIGQPRQLVDEGVSSMLAAPIVGRAQPLGILCVYSGTPRHFTTSDADFLLAMGRQSGSALEHASAYDNLQKADQARAQFVMMVTHELRAPVAGTQVLLKTLVRGIAGDLNDQQRDILVRIENRIEMLMALVNDLLKLAASKTTDTEEPLKRVLLGPILRQVVDRFGKEAETKQVMIALDVPFEALSVRATQLGLIRVMDNLVGNAVKYTPAGGDVYVSVVERPAGVMITVSDTGMGIPAEDLPRVLDGFFRARNARESGIVGTGLGLSIVKQFVDYFDGSISVDSVVGKGTTFKVTLQRAGPADEPALVEALTGADAGS